MLQRLLDRFRRDRRRLVVVPAGCPWLADPQAVPVTELPPAPAARPRMPRWLPLAARRAALGVVYASILGSLFSWWSSS